MDRATLINLIDKVNNSTATTEELELYNAYMNRLAPGDTDWDDLQIDKPEQIQAQLWDHIQTSVNPVSVRRVSLWPRFAAAALVLFFLTFGTYFLLHKKSHQQQIAKEELHDIKPGSNKAILTLANGQQIVLNDAKKGVIANEDNISIHKTTDGKLSYTNNDETDKYKEPLYNMITTPRGGQYALILSDGTKVMLNAASSLKYPASFSGNERKVELTGEAYFEVAHNASKPFKVVTQGQTVEVLGTHFDINSYADDASVNTTLLEGSVKVTSQAQQAMLKPGQQSRVNLNSSGQNIKVIDGVDLEEAVAWKNGLFEFKNASIQQVMFNAARWYDLNVIYENQAPDMKISGKISRNVNLSGLISLLKFGGLRFKIEGKNVTIIN